MHSATGCVLSSGERSATRRTPATIDLNSDKEILAGEHTPECGPNSGEASVHRRKAVCWRLRVQVSIGTVVFNGIYPFGTTLLLQQTAGYRTPEALSGRHNSNGQNASRCLRRYFLRTGTVQFLLGCRRTIVSYLP